MPDIQLSDTERKVLSYIARGVAREQAVEKISLFYKLSPNDVMGAINTLRKQNLVIESKNVASTMSVLTTNPLKVKKDMLDMKAVEVLTERERGTKAGALRKTIYDTNTGEIKTIDPSRPEKKKGPDLGFDLA